MKRSKNKRNDRPTESAPEQPLLPSCGVMLMTMLHDDHCRAPDGGDCSCSPDLRIARYGE